MYFRRIPKSILARGMLTFFNEPNSYLCFRSSFASSGSEAGSEDGASTSAIHAWNRQGACNRNRSSTGAKACGDARQAGNSVDGSTKTRSGPGGEACAHNGRAKGDLCPWPFRI
jgi:hypothetical protein